jgi:predicted RNA-binding protein YlxR (DUF448 family)
MDTLLHHGLLSPVRQCIVTRRLFPSRLLIRFGLAMEAASGKKFAVPFATREDGFTGRSVYVFCDKQILEFAVKGNVFSRAFRQGVHTKKDMVDRVEQHLRETDPELAALFHRKSSLNAER